MTETRYEYEYTEDQEVNGRLHQFHSNVKVRVDRLILITTELRYIIESHERDMDAYRSMLGTKTG